MVLSAGFGTVNGCGPFVRIGHAPLEAVVTLQFSAMLWTLSALVLAAVTAERETATASALASEARARDAERAALQSHARLLAVVDSSAAIIFLKDRNGRYIEINRAFAEVVGRSPEQIIGFRDQDLFSPEVYGRLREADLSIWETGQPIVYMTEWQLKGQPRTYRTTKLPALDASGNCWAICGMSTDVTEQLASEQELRTAKERAELANRAKSEFLANISHEIRTPLTSIFGYAELLQSPELPESSRIEHVQTIRRNGEHLLAILNDVLDMSKIEAGRMTIENLPCSVSALVLEVTSLLRQRATSRELSLINTCRTPIPATIRTDPTRLRQILFNVIGNAVKFTERGQVHADLWLDESHRLPELVIDVIDTGIGMSPEQVAALGQPFSQADPSHARRFGGSGLGLSIGYRLAELLGGSISCQSTIGQGTKFTIRMPTGDLTGIERITHLGDESEQLPVATAIEPARLQGRLLVVEDSPDTLRLLLHHLEKAGLDADPAENGQSAVARAIGAWRSGRPYDLILMDLQMPQMDGLTAVRVLRANGYAGRIVALTANALDADRQRSTAAGFDGFLTKPILSDRLIEAVRQFLAPRELTEIASATSATMATAASNDESRPTVTVNMAGDRLESELADDPDVGPLIPEYLFELSGKAAAVRTAVAAADWQAVGRLAHQIKGSAGGYGYPSLTQAAAKVEAAVRALPAQPIGQQIVDDMLALCRRATRAADASAVSVDR